MSLSTEEPFPSEFSDLEQSTRSKELCDCSAQALPTKPTAAAANLIGFV